MIQHPKPPTDPVPPPPDPDPPPTAIRRSGIAHNPARDCRGRIDHQADAQEQLLQAR
ncbi:hypothetical protein G5B31_07255 [Rhodobacter sp. SGA-6-6]|uniref:hypothetical protein n=1 Tax=Rhodobacter sp. SGA-6-6 TaxID=2710882 RepID=UPI0013ED4E84|nr:hypothetical protein [Rhodobacter sp. SGA-6-6]NGM45330.1 hypothetical protein [Rhodobacter sp. SGA-6-6]